jgi:hypothetical protein
LISPDPKVFRETWARRVPRDLKEHQARDAQRRKRLRPNNAARILGAQTGKDAGLGTEAGRKERTRSPRLQTKSSLGKNKRFLSKGLGHHQW